ncbi:MAG: hypothetical protein WCA23_09470, partial [Stellaceae bacterium]
AGALITWYRTIDRDKAAVAAERSQYLPGSPLISDAGPRVFPLMLLHRDQQHGLSDKVGPTAGHY